MDVQGKVVSKYFEDGYKDRISTADILTRRYGTLARPGPRIALILDIVLKLCMHLDAAEVNGYIPIDWKLEDGGPAAKRHPFAYPPSEMMRLEAIGETVPGLSRTHQDCSRDHVRTGGRSQAAGYICGGTDHQGIVSLPGVR